jgi:hypothetical protein
MGIANIDDRIMQVLLWRPPRVRSSAYLVSSGRTSIGAEILYYFSSVRFATVLLLQYTVGNKLIRSQELIC